MPLINCKAELKLRWTKHCVLSVLGKENDNDNADSNKIIFICPSRHLISKRQSKTIRNS